MASSIKKTVSDKRRTLSLSPASLKEASKLLQIARLATAVHNGPNALGGVHMVYEAHCANRPSLSGDASAHCDATRENATSTFPVQRYRYGVHHKHRELYVRIFKIKTDARYYAKVRGLIQVLDSSMEWKRGEAGGGGAWTIELHGNNHQVPVRGLDTYDLDRLYVPEVDESRTRLDYGFPGNI